MKRMRSVIAIACLLTVPTQADAAKPNARGTTFLQTETSNAVTIPVRLAADAPAAAISGDIRGAGRFLGWALTSQERGGPTVYSYEARHCASEGCRGHGSYPEFRHDVNVREGTIPAGLYELHLLADGARAAYRIDFGVPIVLGNARRAELKTSSLKSEIGDATSRRLFSAGATNEAASNGITFLSLWYRDAAEEVVTAHGLCGYEDPPAASAEPMFGPGCPGGGYLRGAVSQAHPPRRNSFGITVSEPRTLAGLGGWYATNSEVTQAGGVVVWLSY